MSGPPTSAAPFLLVACQVGAEAALKAEVARDWPSFRLAFSRPGFVTFKLPALPTHDFAFDAVFARAAGISLGQATGADTAERARHVWTLAGSDPYDALHVWQRRHGAGRRARLRPRHLRPGPPGRNRNRRRPNQKGVGSLF